MLVLLGVVLLDDSSQRLDAQDRKLMRDRVLRNHGQSFTRFTGTQPTRLAIQQSANGQFGCAPPASQMRSQQRSGIWMARCELAKKAGN